MNRQTLPRGVRGNRSAYGLVMADATLIDPLGRRLVLHDHTWYEHILKGHPDMRNERAWVEAAVSAPESIHFSTSDRDCQPYYGQSSSPGGMGGCGRGCGCDPRVHQDRVSCRRNQGNGRMVAIETLEGLIDATYWFHYDASGDVLYLRLASKRDVQTLGEETDDGFILLRDAQTGDSVGLTIVNWWQRFGQGDLPDSLADLERQIEPWARKLAA